MKKMNRLGLLSLFAGLIVTVSCSSPLKSYQKAVQKAPFDVIIVPGIPFEHGTWESNIMKERILWSYFLYAKGITRNVIYSGSAVYTPYVEGKIMAMYAVALEIPREHVFSETNAEHSTENLVYGYRMAKSKGFEKIAVATDPGQTAALRSFAWDLGLPVTFIPVVQDSLNTMKVDTSLRIDPSPAFVTGFIPLPEREDILKRTFGTMGLEIKDPVQE
jgi:hypothetical protein